MTGRGRGDLELALLFTDLVGFSSWALEAGDAAALSLLREVGRAEETAVVQHGGRIVKRLGDGVMASFLTAQAAVLAALDAQAAVAAVDIDGYRPRMRAACSAARSRRRTCRSASRRPWMVAIRCSIAVTLPVSAATLAEAAPSDPAKEPAADWPAEICCCSPEASAARAGPEPLPSAMSARTRPSRSAGGTQARRWYGRQRLNMEGRDGAASNVPAAVGRKCTKPCTAGGAARMATEVKEPA